MDRVRFGRALGYGTRHAAKTLVAAAEAATAPAAEPTGARTASVPRPASTQQPKPVRRTPTGAGVRGAGRSVWGPLATFSTALWLRVTGLFFGLIALAMANGAWRGRGTARMFGSSGGKHFWTFTAFAALFGYFAVSSFVRTSLRERRAAAPTR